jgi:hypothetical protein
MYENEKMRPVETTPGLGGGGIKENDGGGESKISCKHFSKCHSSTIIC